MLNYIQNSTEKNATNSVIREIHKSVEDVRLQPEVKEEYMTLEDIIYFEREEERVQAILDLLEDYGEIPDSLKQRLEEEIRFDVLKAWHKLAAKVESISDFEEKMEAVRESVLKQQGRTT